MIHIALKIGRNKKKEESVDGNRKIASREREIENISWQNEKETTMVCILCKTKSLILKVPSRIIKMIFTQKLFLITLFLRLFKFFKNNRIIKKHLI